ncbi:MAG TPA: YoaK family protein [Galbitalea sp.]|nr:YoaK family protein [Galbitalea sp.]
MPTLPLEHRFTAGLLLLTVSTGVIDADSYLALDHVFTGNMTGNVLFIGFALVGVPNIPLLNNVIALLGFVAGSIVGGRIVGRGHPRTLPRVSAWTLLAGGILALALATTWTIFGTLPQVVLLVLTFLLAVVMGSQVSAVKPIGNSDVTTIVVTNTLANLARDSRLAGGKFENWAPRLLAILAMGIGAAIGALIIRFLGGSFALYGAMVFYLAGVVVLVVTSRLRAGIPVVQ